jgi:hypothetical protein
MSLFIGVTLALTCLAVILVSNHSLVNQINNKRFLKYGYFVLYIAKVWIFIISISTSMALILLMNQSVSQGMANYLKDDAILYPTAIGYSLNQNSPQVNPHLYQVSESLGVLHAVSLGVEAGVLPNFSNIKIFQVNDNYLKRFPVYDNNGRKIVIDSQSEAGIVLVSEKEQSHLQTIEQDYSQFMTNNPNFKSKTINYYFFRSGQSFPLLDGTTNKIAPDILEVYTRNNASDAFTSELFASGDTYAMLYPLNGRSTAAVYQKLYSALKADGTATIFPSFIRADSVSYTNTLLTVGEPINFIFTNLFAFVLFVLMILASTSLYFQANKKKIAIKGLQGISRFLTHRTFFTIIAAQYILYFVVTLAQGSSWLVVELFAFYMIVEITLVALMLYRLEKQETLNILKGE